MTPTLESVLISPSEPEINTFLDENFTCITYIEDQDNNIVPISEFCQITKDNIPYSIVPQVSGPPSPNLVVPNKIFVPTSCGICAPDIDTLAHSSSSSSLCSFINNSSNDYLGYSLAEAGNTSALFYLVSEDEYSSTDLPCSFCGNDDYRSDTSDKCTICGRREHNSNDFFIREQFLIDMVNAIVKECFLTL